MSLLRNLFRAPLSFCEDNELCLIPYIILIPAHGLGKFISHLGVCHYITKTHLGGQDTLQKQIKRNSNKRSKANQKQRARSLEEDKSRTP
jgi:hypothetical protein